jgi:hypothetical protein
MTQTRTAVALWKGVQHGKIVSMHQLSPVAEAVV